VSPVDPRHGTVAGFVAHGRAGVPACEPCLTAKRRYEKTRQIHGELKVPALGTQRRVQALRALGHSLRDICRAGGWADKSSLNYAMCAETITATTARRVATVYDQLCMTAATGPKANRMRLLAVRNGWPPPLAWDDIDHDAAPAYADDEADVDWVAIERILGGQLVPTTAAERRAVVARWPSTGRPYNDLARLTGWKVERYHTEQEAAA
jgi:hypothetical protein